MSNVAKNRNVYLDILKGVSCVFVIFIHRPFPGTFGNIIQAIGRAGVAVFFAISGYYIYNKSRDVMIGRLPKKIIHIGKILLYALLYYFIWESFIRWTGSGFLSAFDYVKSVFSPSTWYFALLWDKDPVVGHLWFLFALLRCYILFYFLLKFRLEKYSAFISAVCLTGTLLLQTAGLQNCYYRNGWFYGMGFFMAGYFMATYSKKNLDKNLVYAAMAAGLVLSIIGGIRFPKEQIYIGTIILVISSFYWAVTKAGETNDNPIANMFAEIGLKYGTLIYVIHWSLKECLIKVDKMFAFARSSLMQWLSPIILVFLSVVSCVILYHLIDKISNAVRKKK